MARVAESVDEIKEIACRKFFNHARCVKILRLGFIVLFASRILAQEKEPQMLGSANGRFVFGQVGQARSDQYMVDTLTGRLWLIVQQPDKSIALKPVPYWISDKVVSLTPWSAESELERKDADTLRSRIEQLNAFIAWAAAHVNGYTGSGAPNDRSWTGEQIRARAREIMSERDRLNEQLTALTQEK